MFGLVGELLIVIVGVTSGAEGDGVNLCHTLLEEHFFLILTTALYITPMVVLFNLD